MVPALQVEAEAASATRAELAAAHNEIELLKSKVVSLRGGLEKATGSGSSNVAVQMLEDLQVRHLLRGELVARSMVFSSAGATCAVGWVGAPVPPAVCLDFNLQKLLRALLFGTSMHGHSSQPRTNSVFARDR